MMNPHVGVITTSPTTAPVAAPIADAFPVPNLGPLNAISSTPHAIMAAHPARCVLVRAREAR